MKKFLLGSVLMGLLVACSSKEDKMLYEYVNKSTKEAINVSADDIDFKAENINKVKDITVKDSLEILTSYLEDKKQEKIKGLKDNIEIEEEHARIYEKGVKNGLSHYESSLKNTLETLEIQKEALKAYQTDFKGTFLEPTYAKIQEYKKMNESDVLSILYDVSYSIKNPLMGNVKQTIDKTLYTNKENTKFVGSIDKE